MWNEFRQFIARGNVMDLAVAVIIGAAFGAIVTALVVFLMIRAINRLRHKDLDKPPAAPPPREEQLLVEIRDLLKQR